MIPSAPRPAEVLQRLLRFDTTNPPGNERECLLYAQSLLAEAGVESELHGIDDARPNLVARVRGSGRAAPLLLYGHVDVVTTVNQDWTHPPFAGEAAAGFIWGRGALDMKGGVAMMLCALLRAAAEPDALPGDVVIALLSDEEDGGAFGARYLVQHQARLFDGVKYAIGELGGFTSHLGDRRLYPIMVAEKQAVWLRATVTGPGGHASTPLRGGSMARLARMLAILDRRRLPVHITEAATLQIEGVAKALPFAGRTLLRRLLNPALTDLVLDRMGPQARLFDSILHNTATPTILRGGEKLNVIPSQLVVDIDCRILPGQQPADVVRELGRLLGPDVLIEVVGYIPGPQRLDMALFDLLAQILREADPGCHPIPMMLPGMTDAAHISTLGIQTYGFLPMKLPPGIDFTRTIHAADERVPVAGIEFGTAAIHQALIRR